MSEAKEFYTHPGYSQIMARMPDMYLAVCAHPRANENFSKFQAAMGALVRLYETLEEEESHYRKTWPDEVPPLIAGSDFNYACDLLIACYNSLDPVEIIRNASQIALQVYDYKYRLSRMAKSSITYSKSDPRL